jgi:ABC-2 type transport system ATP-binding protein
VSGEPSAGSAAIEVDGLVKTYRGHRVLDGVSLRVGAGEIVALLGPNGAGKTTTVETIEGYRRADGGTVRVLGSNPLTGGPPLRARMGIMLQGGGGVDLRLTAAEVVRLYARFHEPARDPAELLGAVGLAAVAGTRYRRLSGGERQRVALALALVGHPDVLILDEPTAGLDPAARAATRSLVASVRDAGAAVLLTTHDLGDVERLADRVAILDRGRIVAEGPPGVVASSGEDALRVRLAFPADVTGLAAALAGGWARARLEVEDDRRIVTLRGVRAEPRLVAAVTAWAATEDVLVTELRTASASLEDRYLALTGDRVVEHSS